MWGICIRLVRRPSRAFNPCFAFLYRRLTRKSRSSEEKKKSGRVQRLYFRKRSRFKEELVQIVRARARVVLCHTRIQREPKDTHRPSEPLRRTTGCVGRSVDITASPPPQGPPTHVFASSSIWRLNVNVTQYTHQHTHAHRHMYT